MKNILVASYDMEIGGVERSLVSLLNTFNYEKYNLDLLLYSHTGELLKLIPENTTLLLENEKYSTIRKSIGNIIKIREYGLGLQRLKAKFVGKIGKFRSLDETYQLQMMWEYCNKKFPKVEMPYDIAISYLWPHNFVAEKVNAKLKIAWIHTDYSNIKPDRIKDLKIWEKYNYIVGVSKECVNTFLKIYPTLKNRCITIENITSTEFIKKQSLEKYDRVFDKNFFNVLSVARFSHAKGIDQGIEALKILEERGYEDIKWYVIGYGGDENYLKELIKKYSLENRFILLGKKENPYPYMKDCDIYVQPSRYEGKAVTVVEAQILEKSVLITNYPTAKSQVIEGIDGEICELSSDGIANGIERFYKKRELIEKYSKNCKDKNFENREELEKLYELFEQR